MKDFADAFNDAQGIKDKTRALVVAMAKKAWGGDNTASTAMTGATAAIAQGDWEKALKILESVAGNTEKVSTGKFASGVVGVGSEDVILAKAGPYIGPKGGKWADPQHKIPWKEKKGKDKPGMQMHSKEYQRHADEAEAWSKRAGIHDKKAGTTAPKGMSEATWKVVNHRLAQRAHQLAAGHAGEGSNEQTHHQKKAAEHSKSSTKHWDNLSVEEHGAAFHYHRNAARTTAGTSDERLHREQALDHANEAADKAEDAGDGKETKRWRGNADTLASKRTKKSSLADWADSVIAKASAPVNAEARSLEEWADSALAKAGSYAQTIISSLAARKMHRCLTEDPTYAEDSKREDLVQKVADKVIVDASYSQKAELKAVMGTQGREAIVQICRAVAPRVVNGYTQSKGKGYGATRAELAPVYSVNGMMHSYPGDPVPYT